MKGELGYFMKPTKPEAWERCSTEERINRLFEYILPRVDYFKCPVSKGASLDWTDGHLSEWKVGTVPYTHYVKRGTPGFLHKTINKITL